MSAKEEYLKTVKDKIDNMPIELLRKYCWNIERNSQVYFEAWHKAEERIKELESELFISKSEPSDTEMLNWIQAIMTPKENYCEVFLAGLRNGNTDATEFQIESNPQRFETFQAKNIRDTISLAMQKYQKPTE